MRVPAEPSAVPLAAAPGAGMSPRPPEPPHPAVPELPPLPPALRALPALVVKGGVGLGGLPADLRALALTVVWAAVPDGPMTEAAVNLALRAALGDPARFLCTDHVELRRWLVDGGWLERDGFGREYRRVAVAALPQPLREVAAAVRGLDVADCARAWRAADAARREARRRAWAAGQGGRP